MAAQPQSGWLHVEAAVFVSFVRLQFEEKALIDSVNGIKAWLKADTKSWERERARGQKSGRDSKLESEAWDGNKFG